MGQPGQWRHWSLHNSGGRTRGSETSQYPEEKKSKEIPKVEAIEMGEARLGVANILGEVAGKLHQRG